MFQYINKIESTKEKKFFIEKVNLFIKLIIVFIQKHDLNNSLDNSNLSDDTFKRLKELGIIESDSENEQKKLIRSFLYIGNNVWSGANVVFNYGITVWDDSVIGANSFVNIDVQSGTIVAGSPAKYIRGKTE